jgi:hypothetical protein
VTIYGLQVLALVITRKRQHARHLGRVVHRNGAQLISLTQLDAVAKLPIEGGLNDSDLTPHLGKRPGTPLGHHLAGPIVVTNHGAVRIRNVAE